MPDPVVAAAAGQAVAAAPAPAAAGSAAAATPGGAPVEAAAPAEPGVPQAGPPGVSTDVLADLLAIAHQRLEQRPDRYVQHVYGEHEVGGTGWLYLVGRPVQEIGLLELPERAPALRTEAIQHGIFKYGILPVALYGALAGIMWFNHRHAEAEAGEEAAEVGEQAAGGDER